LEIKITIENLEEFIKSTDRLTETVAILGSAVAFKKGLVKTARAALDRALTEAEAEAAAAEEEDTAAAEEDVPVEEDTAAEEDAPAEEKAATITLEEVRAKLAALSQGGKQAEVKALITKYGAQKLSDIPEDKYQALLKEAEEI